MRQALYYATRGRLRIATQRLLIGMLFYLLSFAASVLFVRLTIGRPGYLAFVAGIIYFYVVTALSFLLPWIAGGIAGWAMFQDSKKATLPYPRSLALAIFVGTLYFVPSALGVALMYYIWYPKP